MWWIINIVFYTFQAAPSVGTILQQPAGPVNHGSSVTFTGSYTSNLLSVSLIQWQKLNGSKFIAIDITADKYTGSSVTGPSPKLVINTVQFIDETSYRLMVSNGVGFSVKSSDVLDVTGGTWICYSNLVIMLCSNLKFW